jgi:hypothetical protein
VQIFFLVAFCRAHSIFFDRSFPLLGAHIFFSFYLLPLSGRFLQGSAASGRFLQGSAASGRFLQGAPVRSLPPLRRAQCTFFLFFFACSRSAGPVRARIFFLQSPVSRGVHAEAFPLFPVRSLHASGESFIWSLSGLSLVCTCQGAMQYLLYSCVIARQYFFLAVRSAAVHAEFGRFLSARTIFLCCPVNSRGAHAGFFLFVLSGHLFSAQRAQIFLGHFCSARALALHACQGRPFFPVQSLPAAARKFEFFFFPLLSLVL